MAIIKSKEFNNGAVGEYWRILCIQLFYSSGGNVMESRAEVACYLDKAKRLDGKTPLWIEEVDLTLDPTKTKEFNDLVAMAYSELKKLDAFKDGIDD